MTAAKRVSPPPRRRQAARRGPDPVVLEGFTFHRDGTASWGPRSRPAKVLAALQVGGTWEHASQYAGVHPTTPRLWNDRGAERFGSHTTLEEYSATAPDRESLAYVAFYLAAQAARAAPVVGALDEIDRARRRGDWKAGVAIIKMLPQAKPYRPDPRLELSGPDGAAIPVEVRIAALVENARSYVDTSARELEGVDDDQAGDG